MSFKRKEVIMLPTQDKTAPIYFYYNKIRCTFNKKLNPIFVQDGTFLFQHLYVVSEDDRNEMLKFNEELRRGDYYIFMKNLKQ